MRASAAATQSRLEKKISELNCSNSTSTNQSSQKQDEKDSNKSGIVPLTLLCFGIIARYLYVVLPFKFLWPYNSLLKSG